ncbi:sensor histidine kinase [Corynebacterium caspium]|uniref:sensor histidine kinase n=1 Tax=Corynebacterium caspium TaxID=234828 RepID=UPI00058FCCC4|nr:ATP-binding protein [Corynebacterium caspium]WKD59919.1 Signal-transduction histidine kinase senX3 [Corynebacterium caspium DSM 44850]
MLTIISAFAVGACLPPFFAWIRRRWWQRRSNDLLEKNHVTTISQVLHLVIQGSPTGVVVLDRAGDIVLSNTGSHDMGIVRQDTVNPQVWEIALQAYKDQQSHVIKLPGTAARVGSRILAVRAVVQPLTLMDDRFVIVYSTDESENQRMEDARRDFVANVSHELKTPVGGIALLAEALTESAEDRETVEYFGGRLRKEALRMADLINELIALSKLQGTEALPAMEPVSIDSVIDEAIARNQLAAENHGIDLYRDGPTGVVIHGDKSLLVMALSNLLANAINYSLRPAPVTISHKIVGDFIQLRITDRGIGIAPEDQNRVFERFFRVDKARSRSTGGTGLGLAIVKHVAANHGGNIKLWSRPGTGSTFTLELPIDHPERTGLS